MYFRVEKIFRPKLDYFVPNLIIFEPKIICYCIEVSLVLLDGLDELLGLLL